MNKFILSMIAALSLIAVGNQASAAVVDSGVIEGNSSFATVDHWYFTVNTGGLIQIDVIDTFPGSDPEMNLWSASGGGLGSFIVNDDDSGSNTDPRIIRDLAPGTYALLVGLYALPNDATGFRSVNSAAPVSPYNLNISGDTTLNFVREGNLDGSYSQRPSPVPLPAGGLLLLGGLGALGAARKLKKKTA